MHCQNIIFHSFVLLLQLTLPVVTAPLPAADCTCGYLVSDADNNYYTHCLLENFSIYPDVQDMLRDSNTAGFRSRWYINGWRRNTEAPQMFLDQQFETRNVQIIDKRLVLTQRGYSEQDLADRKPVRVAGIQSKLTHILYGSFRVVMKHEGDTGGAVSSFFWYSVSLSLVKHLYPVFLSDLLGIKVRYRRD